jgi:hypothetical protein
MPDLALLKRLSSSGATDCSASSFAPPEIHLQYHGDAEDAEPVDDEFSEEHVTWCRDAIFRHDVRYIRGDLVERLLRNATRDKNRELSEAWHLLNVLSANLMDNGPTWPRVLEWLKRNDSCRERKGSGMSASLFTQ